VNQICGVSFTPAFSIVDFSSADAAKALALSTLRKSCVTVTSFGGLGIHTLLNLFRVFPGQSVDLVSVTRIGRDGIRIPLVPGDLTDVDQWSWTGGKTLRWRSRLPTDPPFARTEKVYEIELSAAEKEAFTKSVAANTDLMNIARGFLT